MVIEKAYAKINLALDVARKREDGYHELHMIMIPIELHDVLTFENAVVTKLETNVEIKNNAVLKTVEYMKKKYNINRNVFIKVEKNIPIGAGLGGGSADISATLRGLNRLWELNLTLKDLEEDANNLGSDTLFCLYNKPAYVYGRGDKIKFINKPEIGEIYLFNPDIEISTKLIFENHKIEYKTQRFDELLKFYQANDFDKFMKLTYNDLHKTAVSLSKSLEKYEINVKKVDKNAYMTGSGSTFFLIKNNKNEQVFNAKIGKTKLKYIKTALKTDISFINKTNML